MSLPNHKGGNFISNTPVTLSQHKLTATGLIDPDNAKKLGQFAGVDALIMGTLTPKGQNMSLTAKIVTTDTAEIIGAARGTFKVDDTVTQLTSKKSTEVSSAGGASNVTEDNQTIVKSFGDLRVEAQSLQVINGGKQFLVTFNLVNKSSRKSIWVALNTGGMNSKTQSILRDASGYDFLMDGYSGTGVVCTGVVKDIVYFGNSAPAPDRFNQATEIQPGDSLSASVKFYSDQNRTATAGDCSVQLEILFSHDFNNGVGNCTSDLFSAKMNAQ